MTTTKRALMVKKAWREGYLAYKLLPHQIPLYEAVRNSKDLKYVLNCSRRFGKTTVLCLIALEEAIRNPETQIRFAAPTAKGVKKFVHPIFRMLCKDAPEEFRPWFKSQDGMYVFPNHSEIHVAGTDNGHAENLRGTASNLNIIDEAGFCTDLRYVMDDILIPQTLTTGGRTILSSTPPRSPDHDYTLIAQEAMAEGAYSHFTIYDNTSLTEDDINRFARAAGGKNSTTWLREYLAEFVTDKESMIIPEWSERAYKHKPKHDEFYQFYHKYVSLDVGGSIDKTVGLFGYYDFKKATLYVEDETVFERNTANTQKIVESIKEKEKTTFSEYTTYRRISDNSNQILIADLTTIHNLPFVATTKETLQAMVNEVRLWVQNGRVIVSPKCTELLGCLKSGVWKKSKQGLITHEFARSSTLGHFDALAALVYMVRNIDTNTNPIPPAFGVNPYEQYLDPNSDPNRKYNDFAKALGLKKR